MKQIGNLIYLIICLATSVIGNSIHGSIFWSIMDFFFMPFAWLKWLLCHEVNISIIKDSFVFFIK